MKKLAFVSRHQPSESQIRLMADHGFSIEHIGDRDAFAFPAEEILSAGFAGVAVVHPQAAITAFLAGLHVAVFNNVNRAPVGQTPQFETTSVQINMSPFSQ